MNFSKSLSNSYSAMAEKSEQQAFTEAKSAQESLSSAVQEMHDYKHSRSHGTSTDNSFSRSEGTMQQTAFSKYVDKVETFAKENRVSFEEANTLLASASVGLSGGIGSRLLGANAHLGLTKNWNETKSKSEIMSKATSYAEKERLSTLMQKSISESRDKRLNVNDSEGDSYMKGISTQLSKANSHLS